VAVRPETSAFHFGYRRHHGLHPCVQHNRTAGHTQPTTSGSLRTVSRKLPAVTIVSTESAIGLRLTAYRACESGIYNLQSEMPMAVSCWLSAVSSPRLPPASNRVNGCPLSAYGSRLTAPIPTMDDGRTVGQGPLRPRTMHCQTGAAGANDPRRVNDHSLCPGFSRFSLPRILNRLISPAVEGRLMLLTRSVPQPRCCLLCLRRLSLPRCTSQRTRVL
jgi:hypothetical protein